MLFTPHMRFGKLHPKYNQKINERSKDKINLVCDCGKETSKVTREIISGHTTSCGKCNLVSAKEMDGKWFGDLMMEMPHDITSGSGKKVWWRCRCGNRTF